MSAESKWKYFRIAHHFTFSKQEQHQDFHLWFKTVCYLAKLTEIFLCKLWKKTFITNLISMNRRIVTTR